MKRIISLFIYALYAINSYGQAADIQIKERISKIDLELVKATITYHHRDSALFTDIEEVLASLQVNTYYNAQEKVKFYDYLYNFIHDINTNLYASKKIEEREYRRAIRILPSIFHYIKQGQLTEFLHDYPNETSKILSYIQSETEVKQYLVEYALENPQAFYPQLEEYNSFENFNQILTLIAAYDPVTWVAQIDRNPLIAEVSTNSKEPFMSKILDIKRRLGNHSSLFYYLEDILHHNADDSKEIDFGNDKLKLTQKLLKIANSQNAFARASVDNYLSVVGKWVFEDYIDKGESEYSNYSNEELFTLLTLNHSNLDLEDISSAIQYLKKRDDDLISLQTIQQLPRTKLNLFIKKLDKAELLESLYSVMEVNAATYIINQYSPSATKLPLANLDWFTTEYNHARENKARVANKVKAVEATFHLNKTQMSLLSWARNINKVDSNIHSIIQSQIGNRFIDYLAEHQPQIILNNREKLKSYSEFPKIANKVAYYSPNTIKKYMASSDNAVTQQIKLSQEPAAKTIQMIYNLYKFNSKSYSLIHKIIHKELTVEQAHTIANTEVPYLKHLMSITIQKNPIGIHTVEEEQNQLSLKFIRNINDNPSQNHPHLQEIRNFNGKEIYSLMVLGKEEIFQFAFDHCYRVLNNQLGSGNFIDFLPTINYYKYREFCTMMANFGKFPELLYRNTTNLQRVNFVESLVHLDMMDVKCIEQAAVLCEFINNCNNIEIQTIIQNKIIAEFTDAESKKDQLAMAVYSLLASNIGHRAIVNKEWYESMEKKYAKYALSYINVEEVKNKQNKIVEVCYFYNDADGVSSFNNYIQTFRNMPSWYVQDLGSYYFISSLSGVDYEILANKPLQESGGQASIREYLIVNKLEPSIIVHRGHSYHSQKTIDQMIGSPKFIFMGSCGGYYKISELLVRSPNAQILSTKQVGTMGINDPMLKSIHELLRNNKDIDWPRFWSDHEARLGSHKDWKMYVPPHRNNGALFVNAFFKVVGY